MYIGKKEIPIETPPKSLVVIWVIVAAELILDFVTTAIAFTSFVKEPWKNVAERKSSQEYFLWVLQSRFSSSSLQSYSFYSVPFA